MWHHRLGVIGWNERVWSRRLGRERAAARRAVDKVAPWTSQLSWRAREEEEEALIYAAVMGTSWYPLARALAWSEARLIALRFCSKRAAPWSTHACPFVNRR